MRYIDLPLGYYVGTCTNTTVSVSANLLLVIHGMSSGTIHGELGLSGQLVGGGPFHGTINDGAIVFTTCLPSVQMVIEWRAQFSEDRLSGTYSVACDNPQMAAEGLGRTEGVWSCSFVRSSGNLNPENSDLIWVFDEGVSIGPIAKKEFVHHAASGRWPDKAIVATNDRTVWTTISEFLAQKAADEN